MPSKQYSWLAVVVFALGFAQPSRSHAGTFQTAPSDSITQEEALALAFPKCKVERNVVYLKPEQIEAIAKAAQSPFTASVVYSYEATQDGKVVGTAYFDSHKIRTHKQTLMVVVDSKGLVSRIEVLAFAEPRRYLPTKNWFAQIVGLSLTPQLKLHSKVRNMTGATLTARATVACTRRVLALHAEIHKPKPAPVESKEKKEEAPKPEAKKDKPEAKPKPRVKPN